MKFYFTSLDINGKSDEFFIYQYAKFFNLSQIEDADYVALLITDMDNWELDESEFDKIKHKPFVIFDFLEYTPYCAFNNHLVGYNTNEYIHFLKSKKMVKLDDVLKFVYIKCYFKRELYKGIEFDCEYPVYPIEYVVMPEYLGLSEFKIDDEKEYNNRPIDIFFNWGRSNPSRLELHGAFYSLAEKFGYSVVSDYNHLHNEKKYNPDRPIIFTVYSPMHTRVHIHDVTAVQAISKITVSLNGHGVKCFRNSEASVNSLMAIQENSLKWTHEWDESNSIILPNKKNNIDVEFSIKKMIELLGSNELYKRYTNCIENSKLYNQKNTFMNYYEISNYISKVNGFMGSHAQREFMFNLGKTTNKAAEIGSYKGLSAALVVLGMVSVNERQIVPSYYCIDTFDSSNKELNDESTYDEFCNVINIIDKHGIVKKIIRGFSTEEKTLCQIPNDLDWVYVDGDHETDQVIKDIRSYVPLIKKGGLMLFHDHTWDSVYNAIKIGLDENLIEFVCSFDDFGVYKILN